jgi:hypothetical protein
LCHSLHQGKTMYRSEILSQLSKFPIKSESTSRNSHSA